MLHFVRRHAQSKVIWVMVAVIIAVFVLWGVEAVVRTPEELNPVAVVNEQPIEPFELQRAELNLVEAYRDAYKERFTPQFRQSLNLRQRALDALIERALLADQADKLGMSVGDQQLLDVILNNPGFQRDGRFDKEQYLRVLRYSRLTPGEYEEARRKDLLVERVRNLIQDGVTVSDADVRDQILFGEEKVDIAFVSFPVAQYLDTVEIVDGDRVAYFEKNRDKYREPEKARISMLHYPALEFSKGVTVSDEQIQKAYDENKETKYTQPHEVKARHILIKTAQDADAKTRDEARARMEKIAERVKAGEDFAKLATENSEDKASGAQGGDLGYFSRGRMVPMFEEAAFALKPGETSAIVESPFGYHLIRVEDVREERIKDLAEVRTEIENALKKEAATELARKAAEEDAAALGQGQSLEDVASKRGFNVASPEPFARNAPLPGVGRSVPLSEAIWKLEPGRTTEPVLVNQDWVIARLQEKVPERLPELNDVRERVETEVRKEKATEVAKKTATDFLAQAKTSSLEDAAKAAGKDVQRSGSFDHMGPLIPTIGVSQDVKDAAFRLTKEKPLAEDVFVVSGNAYVIAFAERTAPSEEQIVAKIKETRDQILSARRDAVLDRYVKELTAQAKIEVNTRQLETVPQV